MISISSLSSSIFVHWDVGVCVINERKWFWFCRDKEEFMTDDDDEEHWCFFLLIARITRMFRLIFHRVDIFKIDTKDRETREWKSGRTSCYMRARLWIPKICAATRWNGSLIFSLDSISIFSLLFFSFLFNLFWGDRNTPWTQDLLPLCLLHKWSMIDNDWRQSKFPFSTIMFT